MNTTVKDRVLVSLYYLMVVFFSFLILNQLFPQFLNKDDFLQLDAILYYEIAQEGYEGFKMAFFPLFPKLWGVINLPVLGVVVLNALIYLVTVNWLGHLFKVNKLTFFIWLIVPSAMFYFVPYSESFFFVGAVALLIGLKKDHLLLICLSLLICSLTRPAYTVFVPALFILELLKDQPRRETFLRLCFFTCSILLGTIFVAIIQYLDTGEWFKFFEAQSLWGNKLQIPQFPLRSWSDEIIARYDGLALMVGGICTFLVGKEIYRKIKNQERQLSDVVLFSCLYVAGISWAVLLFRGGSLFSLNRFVFATPFFLIILMQFMRLDLKLKWKHYLFSFLALMVYSLLFASYVHITFLIKFILLSLFGLIILMMKSQNDTVKRWSTYFVMVVMFEFQIYLMLRYLDGNWVA